MNPTVILTGATLAFAAGATGLAVGCRACRHYTHGTAVLGVFGTVAGASIVSLFLDGRIDRYFPTVLWVVPALAVLAGGLAAGTERQTAIGVALWTAAFALVFAVRLPWGVSIGSAATIGLAIEALAALFVSVPGFICGMLLAALLRRRAEPGPDNGLRSA